MNTSELNDLQRSLKPCPYCGGVAKLAPMIGARNWWRVAVLYLPGRYFACRQCGGLAYASQKERVGDRSIRHADRIRKRLGWVAGIAHGDGGKPVGMHWQTFWRLKAKHDALVQVSCYDIGRKLGFLHRLLEP